MPEEFEMDYIISILPQMWEGTLETIRLFTITIVLSIPLGVLLALGRVSGLKPLRDAIGVYVWLLRGTPLMLQLLIIYYGPGLIGDNNIWGSGTGGRMAAEGTLAEVSCGKSLEDAFFDIYKRTVTGV